MINKKLLQDTVLIVICAILYEKKQTEQNLILGTKKIFNLLNITINSSHINLKSKIFKKLKENNDITYEKTNKSDMLLLEFLSTPQKNDLNMEEQILLITIKLKFFHHLDKSSQIITAKELILNAQEICKKLKIFQKITNKRQTEINMLDSKIKWLQDLITNDT